MGTAVVVGRATGAVTAGEGAGGRRDDEATTGSSCTSPSSQGSLRGL